MYKIGICDDEKLTCSNLEEIVDDYFKRRGERCELQVWYTAEALRSDMEKFRPDILFLDIEFPTDNGISVGKYIRDVLDDERMNIVYISHKTNYAMELFQIHPYDFLVKPIQEKLVHSIIAKILKLDEVQSKEFRYSYNKVDYNIPYGDILYFTSNNRKVSICKRDGDEVFFYGKLADIAEILPFQFARISKSYIVNMKYISSWGYDHVILEKKIRLRISQSQRSEFKNVIYNYNIREVN